MSLEHRSDPASFANPVATQADFTYSMTLNVIKIQDTGKGAKSVAEDLEAVLRKIKYWHQGSIAGCRISTTGRHRTKVFKRTVVYARTTSLACLSVRSPRKTGCRIWSSRVHSVNATQAAKPSSVV